MTLRKEAAVQIMEHLCTHDWHGYSQLHRNGDGEGVCVVTIDGVNFETSQGDRDCSSAIVDAYECAGISCGGATYTGNMRQCMVNSGNFIWHPMSSGYVAKRGDVYLNEVNHTAMCTSDVPDMLAEFSISETGGIDGATGDQTGGESTIHGYYDYPWDGILECINTDTIGNNETTGNTEGGNSMLNGIDIASYQAGIDLGAVPCDFAIIKATQGTTYVNPDCDRAFQNGLAAGKRLGVYHYASSGGATAEADFFLSQVQGYVGKAILVLDWEAGDNDNFGSVAYAKEFLDRVYSVTGVKPMIYMSMSVTRQYDWSSVVAGDYALWVAQYPDYNATGYISDPWADGAGTGAWAGYAMIQYTSTGSLPNWGASLDLDLFLGSGADWDAYAGAAKATTPTKVVPKQVPGKRVNEIGLGYCGHVEDLNWCEIVYDGQKAGTTGYSKRLEAIKIDIDALREKDEYKNLKMNVIAHIQDVGDVQYTDIKSDTVIGTTGESKRLEAIELEVSGLPAGKVMKFQVHIQDIGWTTIATVKELGAFRGTTGDAKRIEAIRIWIE